MNKIKVPFFRPVISPETIEEVSDTLRSGWLTTGPKVKQFERELSAQVGSRFGVAVNSCTAALHLALEAIGTEPGDLVIVPTMTFAATAEVVRYFDAIPVFVDCNTDLCMNPDAVRDTINDILDEKPLAGLKPPYGKLRALIPMHYGGLCCDMFKLKEFVSATQIKIIEDAAHCFPAYLRDHPEAEWKHAATFGDVGCFSFYANKCITTGEGGMAVTDDEELADRMRIMSLHGMNNDAWRRFTDKGSWYYEVVAPGFKYNMTDIAAAIGIHQLRNSEEFFQKRKRISNLYNEQLNNTPGIELPPDYPATRVHSWHLYSLRLNLDEIRIDRAQFIRNLNRRGIGCSVHWQPLHLQPYYKAKYNLHHGMFPVSEREWLRLVSLPIFPDMSNQEIEYVTDCIKDELKSSGN